MSKTKVLLSCLKHKLILFQDPNESLLTTPQKVSPVRTIIPFSPSQFLNSPNLSFDDGTITSTPIQGGAAVSIGVPIAQSFTPIQPHLGSLAHQLSHSHTSTPNHLGTQPRTPKSRRALLQPVPKTPTPLKNALREIEKKSGPLKHLVDMIFELLKCCQIFLTSNFYMYI